MAISNLIENPGRMLALLPQAGAAVIANRLYRDGDYWQKERAWAGPTPPADLRSREKVIDGVARDFTPIPVIGDSIDRHVNGVIGREPAFALAAKNATKGVAASSDSGIEALDALAGAWFDKRIGHEILWDFVQALLCDERASLRFFVPPDIIRTDDDGSFVSLPSMAAALDEIYFEVPAPDTAAVVIDADSLKPIGVYRYTRRASIVGTDVAETITTASGFTTQSFLEITFVEDGLTFLRVQKDDEILFETALALDGEILTYEARRRPFVTESARRLQNSINFLNSMLPKNGRYAGYRSRHGIGLEHPVEVNPATGQEERVPITLGAGAFNLWKPTTYEDDNGVLKAGPAQMVIEEPVDSAPIRADIAHLVEKLLETFDQSHILLGGDGASSAIALVQKRAAFAQSLNESAPKVEGALRWLIRTALLLAAALSDDAAATAMLKGLRVNATARVSSGPLSPDERRVIVEEMQAGVISRETAMTLLGIEDLNAETERLAADEMRLHGDGHAPSGMPGGASTGAGNGG